jgi:hypothetical protein
MQTPQDKPIIALVDRWGAHFGYYDGKIDLKVDDLSSFATPDCTLTAHAPLWGTKEGEESALPAFAHNSRECSGWHESPGTTCIWHSTLTVTHCASSFGSRGASPSSPSP